jgi:membrane fusion protein (multidrug efflux system)
VSRSTLLCLMMLALPGLVGCGTRPRAGQAVPTATPALPEEVAKVAAAMAASPAEPVPAASAEAPAEPAEPGTSGEVSVPGEFVSPVRSELAVRFPGRVGKVLVDAGDRVRAGQPVLELEDDYLRLDLQRADAELRRAQAAADEATRDFERKKDLVAKESVSPAVFDRTKAANDQALAALAGAEAAQALARQRLEDAVLRSPIDGVVAERRTDVGERLGDNSVAFVIIQMAPLKLRFKLPERYLTAVAKGQTVRATADPFPGEAFEGRVSSVVQAVDPASRTFVVEAEFPNRDGRLRPGLFARVELTLGAPARGEG